MKKTVIVFLFVIFALALGCRKKPVEPQPMPVTPAAGASSEVRATVNTEPVPATAKTDALTATPANTGPVPVTINQPAPTDKLAWITDFEAAKKKAAAEGKDLFINFTGSDWCGWCIRLDKEVLSKPLFIYEAQKHFVFVYIDFPRNKKQNATLKAQNEQLAQRYEAEGFPTIILAQADGKPYAKTGYLEGGPMAYLQELAKLQQTKPAK